MDLNDIFASDSLKAADLKGKEVPVTIESYEVVEFDDGKKIVIRFAGADKTLVCNKTNARTIADMYGSNVDAWVGKRVTLIPAQTDFNGRQVPCIRVKLATPQSEPTAVPDGPSAFSDSGNESPF